MQCAACIKDLCVSVSVCACVVTECESIYRTRGAMRINLLSSIVLTQRSAFEHIHYYYYDI